MPTNLESEPLGAGQRRVILTLTLLAVASVSYSLVQSIIGPALDTLREHVHTDGVGISWVLTAFLLASAVLTPVIGKLGDIYGRREALVAVLGLVAVGSALCAVASSLPLLVAGRLLQGAGEATLPLAFGIIRDLVPRRHVSSAVGAITAISAAGGTIGILVTGPILDGLGVPWLFALPAIANAVVGLVVLIVLPPARPDHKGHISWLAAGLLAATLVLLLLPLSLGDRWGWGSPVTITLLVGAALVATVWVRYETRSASPLIDMQVFGLRPVWTANLTSLLLGVTLYSAFGFIPLFLQVPTDTGYGFGASVTLSGLLFVPLTVTQLGAGLFTGALGRVLSPKVALVLGAVPMLIGFVLLTLAHTHIWEIVVATAIAGVGFGISLSALSAVVVTAVPAQHTGAATGMNANIRSVGGALGAALVASVLAATGNTGGFPTNAGFTTAFGLLAAAALLGLVSSLLIPAHTRKELA